jgi:hypothetical protein
MNDNNVKKHGFLGYLALFVGFIIALVAISKVLQWFMDKM